MFALSKRRARVGATIGTGLQETPRGSQQAHYEICARAFEQTPITHIFRPRKRKTSVVLRSADGSSAKIKHPMLPFSTQGCSTIFEHFFKDPEWASNMLKNGPGIRNKQQTQHGALFEQRVLSKNQKNIAFWLISSVQRSCPRYVARPKKSYRTSSIFWCSVWPRLMGKSAAASSFFLVFSSVKDLLQHSITLLG